MNNSQKRDAIRIRDLLLGRGIHRTLQACHSIWQFWSMELDAGWLYLPEDDEGLWHVLTRIKERTGKDFNLT